jgi:hypothetical protein
MPKLSIQQQINFLDQLPPILPPETLPTWQQWRNELQAKLDRYTQSNGNKGAGRPRIYKDNAERQRAFIEKRREQNKLINRTDSQK